MPIFRLAGRLVYFAHIPKAGGTSVAQLISKQAQSSAMVFDGQWKQRPASRWSSTSPQHISAQHLSELFPDDFFDYSFAVVRHPEDRVLSEYRYRAQKSLIHKKLNFSQWLQIVLSCTKSNPFVFDGHLRPQVDFLPANTKVFKLEEGLSNLAAWIDNELGTSLSQEIPKHHANRSQKRPIELGKEDRQLIEEFYRVDYEQLNYQTRDKDELPSHSALKSRTRGLLGSTAGAMTQLMTWRIPY